MFKIAHLYPKELNLYGDNGNILYLQHFLRLYGIESQVYKIHKDVKNIGTYDLIFAGGGPDSLQNSIYLNFLEKKEFLQKHIEANKPAVFICGSFQLLGDYYLDTNGSKLKGLSLFNFYTRSPSNQKQRLVGNLKVKVSSELSTDLNFSKFLVGFENHNGRSFIGNLVSLGLVGKKMSGNNDVDYSEGLIYKRTIGTYLHGPVLVKNPQISAFLLQDYIKDLHNVDLRNFSSEFIAHNNALKLK